MNRFVAIVLCLFVACVQKNVFAQNALIADARWCVINDFEMRKCTDLVSAVNTRVKLNRTYSPDYMGAKYPDLPQLKCVQAASQYDCMIMIKNGLADIMQLETGLSYTAGEYYNMMPLVAEKYQTGTGDEGLDFYAVAVVKTADAGININTMKGKKACIPGVGQAAGWIYPVAYLIENKYMDIAQCNVPVKSAAAFFGEMCAPDGLARYYNPFGNNPATVCQTCKGTGPDMCSVNDPYAGYTGAMDCLLDGNDIAFVRHTTVAQYLATANSSLPITKDDFQLVCIDGSRASVDDFQKCNWGKIASHVVMTSAMRNADTRSEYIQLLTLLSMDFGVEGKSTDLFNLFNSIEYGRHNLMFTDETVMLKDINTVAGGNRNTYYTWVVLTNVPKGQDLKSRNIILNSCPIPQARWCVISPYEMTKCENMIMAFAARNLKPDLNCIMGDGVQDCIKKIKLGDADLISLDASDVYTAGKKSNLVPIAAEDYSGKDENGYYAVAIARRRFSYLTLNNLKQRRTCHSAVMSAAGWVIPVDVLLQTGQINIDNCDAYLAVSQYFSKSCVPGVLDKYYNPYGTNPVTLCEACSTAGPRRCMRSDQELYYGSSGAFRCLVEVGGDVAFVRHTTVRENTDGRNLADWSRNRRSDDYELLCNDGRRQNIDMWDTCNLGHLPSNAVMTAGFKTAKERDIYWTLLSYAQQFFDADNNPDFAMFDSMLNHRDLIFQDATVRLIQINSTQQNYIDYLGPQFLRAMQRMDNIDCVTGSRATTSASFNLFNIFITTLSIITLSVTV